MVVSWDDGTDGMVFACYEAGAPCTGTLPGAASPALQFHLLEGVTDLASRNPEQFFCSMESDYYEK